MEKLSMYLGLFLENWIVYLYIFLISGKFDWICLMFFDVDHHAESQPFTLLTLWPTSHKTAQHGVKNQDKWIPDLDVLSEFNATKMY